MVVWGRRRRRRGVVALFEVSTALHRGSCVVCGISLCIAAYVRPAREHDSLIFMYFVLFWRVSCFVCVIVCAADMRTREVGGEGGGRRVCLVICDRSVESGEITAWRRGCEGVRREWVLVCVIRHVSLLFPFWRVSCFVCVIACAADVRARNEAARGSCRARSLRVKRRVCRVTSRPWECLS